MDPPDEREIGSQAWYDHTLRTALGYDTLKHWQLEGTMHICNGGDVVCIVATGAGKSALVQGPIIAQKAMRPEKPSIGIVVVPTKGLADDQARAANAKGINALALHQDSVRAASEEQPRRNLFEEIRAGKWNLVFLSPEMLISQRFSSLLDDPEFLKKIDLLAVDECHLVDEWKSFRTPYQNIKRLRNRLPSHIPWVALSATVAAVEFRSITEALGFLSGRYKLFKEPVDQPRIKYVPRFLQHSNASMLDFSTIIPYNMRSIYDVPITIIFANTISFGRSLRLYLTSLLPGFLTGRARKYFIRGFHGMSSANFRARSIEALKAGTETRIFVCTDTGTFGIDIREIEQVIIAQHSKTFKTQIQRIGRIREGGTAVVYYQGWMSKTKNSKEAIRLRGEAENVMVEFANASAEFCPRQVACQHWGEPYIRPRVCCSLHDPGANEEKHKSELALRVRDAKKLTAQNRKVAPGPNKFPPVNKSIVLPAIISVLQEWRLLTWQSISTRHAHDPATLFLSDETIKHLAARVRACTSMDIFKSIMAQWTGLDTWGDKLYGIVSALRETAEEFMSKLESKDEIEGESMEIDEPEVATNGGGNEETQELAGGSDNAAMLDQDTQENGNIYSYDAGTPQEGVRRSKRLRKSHPDYVT